MPPSLVDDSATTRENVPVKIPMLDSDMRGYQMLDGTQVPVPLNVSRGATTRNGGGAGQRQRALHAREPLLRV